MALTDFTIDEIEQHLAALKAECLDLLAQSGALDESVQRAADDAERTRLVLEQIDLMEKSDIVWARHTIITADLDQRKSLEAAQEKI